MATRVLVAKLESEKVATALPRIIDMRVTYVTRSFLDYRVPVWEALCEQLDGNIRFIYSADYVPRRCQDRIQVSLRDSAIGLRGEVRLGPNELTGYANRSLRLVYQPGIWSAIRRTEPDVLIGDGFYQWTSFALAYRIFRRVGLVICYERTFHTERAAQRFRVAYRRAVVNIVDAMAVNGSLSKTYANSLGMDEERITCGQMAADSDLLAARAAAISAESRVSLRHSWGNPELAMIVVGRLNAAKGVSELLQAWSLLENRKPGNWRLVIVGDGPMRDSLIEQSEGLGLHDVIFSGHIPYDDIAEIYAAADALVMPTLEDNWSLVVPEAMACGLPVLCSIYNGCYPELIVPGKNGWTFDPLDTEDTYSALARCIQAGSVLTEMSERSKVIASSFTPTHAAASIVDACKIAYHRFGH